MPIKLRLFLRLYNDLGAVAAQAGKADAAVLKGEQRVVAAATHIKARMDLSSALANQNVPCQNHLAVSALRAQAL